MMAVLNVRDLSGKQLPTRMVNLTSSITCVRGCFLRVLGDFAENDLYSSLSWPFRCFLAELGIAPTRRGFRGKPPLCQKWKEKRKRKRKERRKGEKSKNLAKLSKLKYIQNIFFCMCWVEFLVGFISFKNPSKRLTRWGLRWGENRWMAKQWCKTSAV